jgi:endo-1,4-beta-xylanase
MAARVAISTMVVLGLAIALTGCAAVFKPGSPSALAVSGVVHAGQQPIAGATVQLYAVGKGGTGSTATPLIDAVVKTNSNGEFSLAGKSQCPSADSDVYVVASGGTSNPSEESENSAIALMAMLGPCVELSSSAVVSVNEATTVGSVWPISAFINSASAVGYGNSQASQFNNAITLTRELVNMTTGSAPGGALAAGDTAPTAKLYALAEILSGCVTSRGGNAGESSPCGTLFEDATYPDSPAPTDTIQAALAIAKHPTERVNALFELIPSARQFTPVLGTPPSDWTLAVGGAVNAPFFSLPSGIYSAPQQVEITEATKDANIFYTVDGSAPSLNSTAYTGPFSVSGSTTLRAVAMKGSASSSISSVTLTMQSTSKLSLAPLGVILGPTDTMRFVASLDGGHPTGITWSVNPARGSISSAGVYTAPDDVSSQTTVTVTAANTADGSVASAIVNLLPTTSTLRSIADSRGLLMGSAADADEYDHQSPLTNNPSYANTLSSQYNMLEAENAMKWAVIGAQPGTYNFEPGDNIVAFARQNNMAVRGHNLCWWQQNPAWLSNLSSSSLYQTLHDYIFTVMGHYKGQVFAWDVVNEAIANDATGSKLDLTEGVWYKQPGIGLSGTGYIEQAFRWARQADPSAKLFYNDHGIETIGGKQQALLNMLKDFVARGVPIDGVGLEMHVDTTTNYPRSFPQALKTYTDLGLEVHITELDVRLPVNSQGMASASDLKAQADTYSFIVSTCLQNPHCTAIQTWGFTDEWSWIPKQFPGYGAALPFDKNYQGKPAYKSILNTLQILQ